MNKQKTQDVSGAKVRYHSAQLPMGCGTAGHPELEEAIILDGIFLGSSIVRYTYMYILYMYICMTYIYIHSPENKGIK